MKKLMFLTAAVSLSACSASDASKDALQKQGFTDIVTTGWSPLSCGQDDFFSTGFTADNPNGQRVSGVVCCGLLKGCTVRF